MVAPWRVSGLALLLLLAAACGPTTDTPTATARPTFTPGVAANRSPTPTPTDLGQAVTSTALPQPTGTPTDQGSAATPGAGTPTASGTAGTPAGTPSATPTIGPCTNDVDYIADLSVPDGTVFEPGQPVLKQWSVRNAGACDWDAGYRLVLVSGNALGARSELALYPARAGLEAVIEVAMIAPGEPGSYTGRWQARDPAGNVFGDRIFITIVVAAPATPTETPTPTP